MRKKLMAASVETCFGRYRSAINLNAAYRLRWYGTTQKGLYVMETPEVWGRFA